MVMDFNSLYPSIIQEYNIDFTTVERDLEEHDDEEDKIPDVPESGTPQGVLPRIIATLVGRRRQVKGLMKDKSASAAKLQQVCLFETPKATATDGIYSTTSNSRHSSSLRTRCTVVSVSPVRDSPPDLWPP